MTEHMEILFKEYDTLRAEVISRSNNAYQLVSVGVATGGALLAWFGSHGVNRAFWLLLGMAAIAFGALVIALAHDVKVVAMHLRDLESEINKLAGATLLQWETKRGAGATVFGKIFRMSPD